MDNQDNILDTRPEDMPEITPEQPSSAPAETAEDTAPGTEFLSWDRPGDRTIPTGFDNAEPETVPEPDQPREPALTPAQQRRLARQKALRRQQLIRLAGILIAIVLAFISLCVSCSTRAAVQDLAAQLQAKKAAAAEAEEAARLEAEAEADAVYVPTEREADAAGTVSVTISFGGDCTLSNRDGQAYAGSFDEVYETEGAACFFENVRSIFEGDDLTVINLEGTFTASDTRADKLTTFAADPSHTDILSLGGIDAANVANDHTDDYGDEGYADTLAALDVAGIARFGHAYTTIVTVKDIQVGLSGVDATVDSTEAKAQAIANIKSLREDGAQLIVCCFHWGEEGSSEPGTVQVALAHAAIDAGADIIVGTGTGVMGGIEEYKGAMILYSLGTLVDGSTTGRSDMDTFIFSQTFVFGSDGAKTDTLRYEVIPCSLSSSDDYDYCPMPLGGEPGEEILSRVRKLCGQLSGGITIPDGGVYSGE